MVNRSPLITVICTGFGLFAKCQRDNRFRTEPNYVEGFEKVRQFIQEGSTVRETDRAGIGTKGTRLMAGIGAIGVKTEVYSA